MKIQSTQDYTLFKRIPGNRILSKPHVNRLLEAIKEDPETITYNPIIVNSKFEVIDGQHRLEAIKKLGLDAYYIQVDDIGLETVQKLNSLSKQWSPMDYAKSYAENGNENYQTYIDFKNEFRFNHDILMRYMAGDKPITGTLFKKGKFIVPNVKKAWQNCDRLRDFGQHYERAAMRNFAFGYLIVLKSEVYNHDHMLKQIKQHSDKFVEQPQATDYAREVERIYNLRQHEATRLF